jgi:hypothetical protein
LAIPHISIKDISQVDWGALRSAGMKGCVFDKDNTLCKPFALTVDPALLPSLEECLVAFDGKVALFSNSAGLKQYDPDGTGLPPAAHCMGLPCAVRRLHVSGLAAARAVQSLAGVHWVLTGPIRLMRASPPQESNT